MSPKFEFDHFFIVTAGPIIINLAGGDHDSQRDTDVFLPRGTASGIVEKITDDAEKLKAVSLIRGESSSNLRVNGEEQSSVSIPAGFPVTVHSS